MNFLLRFLLTALAGFLLCWYQPDREHRDQAATLLAAVAISLFNSFLKPGKIVKRQPFTLVTLGIFITALNTVLVLVCDRYIPGFDISGWPLALLVGACMAVVSILVDRFVGAE